MALPFLSPIQTYGDGSTSSYLRHHRDLEGQYQGLAGGGGGGGLGALWAAMWTRGKGPMNYTDGQEPWKATQRSRGKRSQEYPGPSDFPTPAGPRAPAVLPPIPFSLASLRQAGQQWGGSASYFQLPQAKRTSSPFSYRGSFPTLPLALLDDLRQEFVMLALLL
jgi:hypothetical protein